MRRAHVAALIALGLMSAVGLSVRAREPSARAAAVALYEKARHAALNGMGEQHFELALASLEADPTYTPALLEVARSPAWMLAWEQYQPQVDQALHRITDLEQAHCAHRVIWRTHEDRVPSATTPPRAGSDECRELFALFGPSPDGVTRALRLWRKYPESPALANHVQSAVFWTRDWERGIQIATEMLNSPEPLVRADAYGSAVAAHKMLGRDTAAARVDSIARADLASQAMGALHAYLQQTRQVSELTFDQLVGYGDAVTRRKRLIDAGTNAYEDGRLVASEQIWNLMLRESGHLQAMRAHGLLFRGRTHMKAGRLAAAEADLTAAREPALRVNDRSLLVQVNHNLFHVYEGRADRQRALAAGHAYLEAASADSVYKPARMMAYHDLGWYHFQLGEYERGRVLLDRMLGLIDTMQTLRHYAGEYYERIGQLDRALHYYEISATIDRNDYRAVARRAVMAAQLGDTANAIRWATLHDNADGPAYPEFTPQLPGILATFGLLDRAAEAARRGTVQARARGQAAAQANLLLERASLELRRNHPAISRTLADSAVIIAQTVAAFETQTLARGTRELARVMADPRARLDSLRTLARSSQLARLPALQYQMQVLLARGLSARRDTRGALAAFSRAAALTDSLAASLGNDTDRARYRGAANDVTGDALDLILREGSADFTRSYASWSVRRKARGLSRSHGRARPQPAPGVAVIDYVVLDSVVAALVVTRNGTTLRKLPIAPSALRAHIIELRSGLTPRIGSLVDLTASRFNTRIARELHGALIAPLSPALDGVHSLVVVGDGPLHYLPFEALLASDTARDDYLIRRYTIRYAPSLDLVGAAPPAPQGRVLFFGSAAADASPELDAVTHAMRNQARLLLNRMPDAREHQVRRDVGDARIVHFATHAAINDAAPPFAYLRLQADEADDGRLHAFEIERLRFNGALVVLSGCDTGGGRIAGGEGVLSLSRAFLRAGASATVATLWPVGSGTPDFMGTFYTRLGQGADPATALRDAKLQALNGPYSSPLYWAAFVLITA